MVIKSRMLWMWAGLLLLGLFTLPCLGQADPGAAQAPDQKAKAAEAAGKITPVLDAILMQANESKSPAQKELSAAQTLVDTTKRYFSQMEDKQKAQYCLLQSWLAYYSGQVENAHANAVKAWKLDATSGDIWATQVAMALVADKKPMLPRPPKPARAQRNRPQGQGAMEGPDMMRNSQDAALQIQPGKLKFDLSQFLAEAVGKKIEPFQLTCLNGTTFGYQPGSEALCVLCWKKFETAKAAVSNEPNQGGEAIPEPAPMPPMMRFGGNEDGMNGQISEETPRASFGKLFLTGFAGGERVKFAAINLDSVGGKRAVIDQLLNRPQAWAQILIADQAAGAFPEFGAVSPDKPVLMMADSTGAIRYAGPAMGFIAPMLLHQFLRGDLMELAAPAEIRDVTDTNSLSAADSNSVAAPVPAAQTPAVKPAQQTVNPQPQELSEEDAFQAGKKLEFARGFIPIGAKPGLNYARGVKLCREIMKDYPGSEYAEEARKLLLTIPENERARYKLTDDELGL